MKTPTARLLSNPDEEFVLYPETFKDGFTQSEISTMDTCGERWFLNYNERLRPKGLRPFYFIVGDWIHDFMEEYYSTKGQRYPREFNLGEEDQRNCRTKEQLRDLELWQGITQIMTANYASRYRNDHKFLHPLQDGVEHVVEYEHEGIILTGKLDLEFMDKGLSRSGEKGFFLMDHKSASRIDRTIVIGWSFRFQFMFYCWLAWKTRKEKVRGYYVNVLRKPGLKLGETESIKQYLQRFNEDIHRREADYYWREQMLMTKGQLERFEKVILEPKLKRLRILQNPDAPAALKAIMMRNKNTEACTMYGQVCPYLQCCQFGLEHGMMNLQRRETKHSELSSD